MIGDSRFTVPRADEVEVSLFGPGFGEAILLHIGHGKWLAIDCCVHPTTKEVIPLSYLRKIGVNPSERVVQVIATHWHDDHIRGISQLLRECSSAEFVCADALRADEFRTLVVAYGYRAMTENSGVKELFNVVKILRERKSIGGSRLSTPKWAIADRSLLTDRIKLDSSEFSVSIQSLSPSDAANAQSKMLFANMLPKENEIRRAIPDLRPNLVSVAVSISAGPIFILLGGDLEEVGKETMGWSAILKSKGRPDVRHSAFKVPHHGSSSGDHPSVWTTMLTKDPVAVLTPLVKGKSKLPGDSDIKRLKSRTQNVFATGIPTVGSRTKRDRVVEKTIKEVVRYIRPVFYAVGQVRLRTQIAQASWSVELFDGAVQL